MATNDKKPPMPASATGLGDRPKRWSILDKHGVLERNVTLLAIFAFLVVTIGGLVQIVPLFYLENTIEDVEGMRPYTPLELAGRDIYIREGCYTCHSQMIRPLRAEIERYGEYSKAGEFVYDHPFQWGSRRIGPDLARVGGKYADVWHYKHMINPREISIGSNMPPYPHLATETIDFAETSSKLRAMRAVGVPYDAADIQTAEQNAYAAASGIAAGLAEEAGVNVCEEPGEGCDLIVNSRLVALISYLQRLGRVPADESDEDSDVGTDPLASAEEAPQ